MPADTVLEAWERRGWLSALLRPAAGLFAGAAAMRRTAYRKGWARSFSAGAPVVIVGNISVGGTGKTPITGWLAQALAEAGCKPAIVSRGYGGRRQNTPVRVTPLSDAGEVGDEPVMLAKQAE
ncbi:MAG: tetraacyldisaccharide 4'-kinase, partial [Chromatiales bacterium]|nr:tetraacyldisaccharide 4'-kinase [Chromatiales bacterium]